MSERLPQPATLVDPKLHNQDVWHEIMMRTELSERLNNLVGTTQELAIGTEGADWASDRVETMYRWQRAIQYVADFSMLGDHRTDNKDISHLADALTLVETMITPDETAVDAVIRGWHPDGLGFVVVNSGFGWMYERGGFSKLKLSWCLKLDLRDFTRLVDPVPETYEAYQAMSKRERKKLPKLIDQISERTIYGSYEWGGGPNGYGDGWSGFRQSAKLLEYRGFDKHGVPDIELTEEDIVAYVADLIAHRVTRDAEYDSLPVIYEYMSEDMVDATASIMEYFVHKRRVGDEPAANSYSLIHNFGYDQATLDALVQHGVLTKHDTEMEMNGQDYDLYFLGRDWEGVWLNSLVYNAQNYDRSLLGNPQPSDTSNQ